jgi:hypothetical protein
LVIKRTAGVRGRAGHQEARPDEHHLLLRRQRVVEGEQAGLDGLDALDPRLHDVLFHRQAVDVVRPLLHLGRQGVAARDVLDVGIVGRLGEGVPRRHLLGLELEPGLDVGAVAGAAGDMVEAEGLGIEGRTVAAFLAAGRRG